MITDELINAVMDHEFAIASGKIPADLSVAGIAFLDTENEERMTQLMIGLRQFGCGPAGHLILRTWLDKWVPSTTHDDKGNLVALPKIEKQK